MVWVITVRRARYNLEYASSPSICWYLLALLCLAHTSYTQNRLTIAFLAEYSRDTESCESVIDRILAPSAASSHIASNMSLVESVSLLAPRPFYLRLDTLPFALVYVILFWQSSIVLIPIVLSCHLLLFMIARSFTDMHAALSHSLVTIQTASKILVHATKNSGRNKIVDLSRSSAKGSVSIANSTFEIKPTRFEFQKVCFSYDASTGEVRKLEYVSGGRVADLLAHQGHSDASAEIATTIWGKNEFEIPMPGFLDVYFEHLIAPFFVFQVVCLVLWSLGIHCHSLYYFTFIDFTSFTSLHFL